MGVERSGTPITSADLLDETAVRKSVPCPFGKGAGREWNELIVSMTSVI